MWLINSLVAAAATAGSDNWTFFSRSDYCWARYDAHDVMHCGGLFLVGTMYSILLPTYNERENLPLIVWLINKAFTESKGLVTDVAELSSHCCVSCRNRGI